MSQANGFDLSKLSTASKILLGAGILYLIDLFLPWNRACADLSSVGLGKQCAGVNGIHGLGALNLILVLALLAWEAMAVADVQVNAPRALISAGLAGAILVFTILKILVDTEFIYLWAWVGLLLALAVGYGGWMRWQEHQTDGGMTTGSSGDAPGGFTS